MIVVPDASVILKWVLEQDEGPDLPKAFALQQAFLHETIEIRVPTLWRYEVGNILGLKQPALAVELMTALLAYEFQEAPLSTEDCVKVLNLMHTIKGITFYDAAYHVLAMQLNGLYITADAEYTKRARRQGHVRLLSAWDPPEG